MITKLRISGSDKGEYAVTKRFNRFAGICSTFGQVIEKHVEDNDEVELTLDNQAVTNLAKEIYDGSPKS